MFCNRLDKPMLEINKKKKTLTNDSNCRDWGKKLITFNDDS